MGGAPLPSSPPPFAPSSPSPIRPPCFYRRGKDREKEKERGAVPPPLIQFGLLTWGYPCGLACLPPMAHKAHIFPGGGGSGNLPVLQNSPETTRTIPVSECNLPIYEYLPLGHFESPRHVRDIIRDSEQTLVIKSHNS